MSDVDINNVISNIHPNGELMILKIKGISGMNISLPLLGKDYFLGTGEGMPNDGSELIVNSIPTRD